MSTNLTYEKYSKDKIAIKGDKDLYSNLLKNIGARWNPRMKGGEGWLIPLENEEQLKALIETISKSDNIESLKKNAKPRKDQKKYHRAISPTHSDEDFDSSEEESEEPVKKVVKKIVKKVTQKEEKEEKRVEDKKPEKKEDKKVEKKLEKKVEEKKVEKKEEKKVEVKKPEKKIEEKKVEKREEKINDKIITKIISKTKPREVTPEPKTPPKKVEKRVEAPRLKPDEKYKKYNSDKIKFYQQFARNDFDDISETSSELEESSSDDFPSPSPVRQKHRKEDYSKLGDKLRRR